MKNLKLRWLFYFVLLGLCLQAQVNNQFKLQLYLADQNGNIYVNRNIGLKISILKSENDFPIYSERQVLTSDATGLLNIPIGAGTNRVGNIALFSQLSAGFIKIEYDPSGGSNYTRMLLQPLVSVPYASISNYALGLKGRGITANHFADSSILVENLDFNPAKKEDVEILKSWIDIYTNGSIPTLITYSSSPNAIDTAQISAIVSSDGGDSISEKGFVYSLTPNPTINNLRLKAGRGNANFSGVLKGLNASSTYHVRSYAMNRLGIGYGNPITITTALPLVLPTITTTSASSILETSAITGGNVTSDGGAAITERGVVYATSGIPSLSNSKVVAGTSGTGTYTVNLTGLTGSTKYYFRAYATNSAGTGYGSLDSFVTLTPVVLPTITTTNASSILTTSAITGGNVTSDGGATVTERGVVYAISGIPSISDSKVVAGISGTGTYTVNLTGLTGSTKYFFRAYATNSAGTGYGTIDSFVTLTPVVLPTLTTTSASSILETSATTGGNVISDGGATVTERGVVYVISGIPSISDSKIVAGTSGTGTYTVNLTGLAGSTKYFFRAYATNSAGTGYGALDSFVTLTPLVLPTITTTPGSTILATSAVTGGNVTSDGGATVTERGVVYATSGIPSLSNSKVVAGTSGTGTYTVNLSGLTGSTRYYFRAYATNSVGTGYGSLDSMTTLLNYCPSDTIVDIDGNVYNTVSIGSQCWTKENLRVTKYRDGTSIPTGLDDGTWLNTSTGAYAIYNNDPSNDAIYGKLYNWYAVVDPRALCPSGWHVPSDTEWTTLSDNLGGNIAGGKMKSTGTTFWTAPNMGATNQSGFTGLPGGFRNGGGGFYSIGDNAYFWSVTVNLGRALDKNDEFVYISNAPIGQGNSVRCLKDTGSVTTAMIPTLTSTVDSIKSITARSGGNISSDGGATVTERGVVWSTSSMPTISLTTKTSIGTGTGSFTSHITGLRPNTTYYIRAYAINSAGTGYGNEVSFTTIQGLPCPGAPIVTDIDGNEYNTVSIGTQCWTKENIRVTKYNDGTAIPLDTSGGILGNGVGETWSSLTTGARSIYGHSENNIPSYGYLYNWFAATDAKGLCPSGWHLPTEPEWIELKNFLGGSFQAAYNMKDVGTTHWNNTDINITNESGFTAMAGGYRHPFDSGNSKGFDGFGTAAFYWSNVGYFAIGEGNTGVNVYNNTNGLSFGSGSLKKLGVSVRCLKDAISSNNSTLPTLSTIMVDSISSSTVRSGGNIVSDGGDSVTIRGVVWSIKPNPTISAPSKTWNGTGSGLFMSSITNLSPNTTYYLRAYAINNTGVSYGNELTFITSSAVNQGVPCSGLLTISDIDGNSYNTVAIGSQCWTRENLKVSRYNDGTIIPLDSSGGVLGDSTRHTWGARTIGARTVYGQDSFNLQTYGYLYNWYAAKGIFESDTTNLKNLCPTGWHVPTDGEWTLLSDYLGGESIAGNKVKTTGTAHWIFPNTGSTNESGFSALPGGFRTIWGSFGSLNDDAYFASSTSYDSDFSWFRYLSNNSSNLGRYYSIGNTKKSVGFSVRCLKDTVSTPSTTVPTLTTTAADSVKTTTARSGGNITSDGGCTITSRGVVWSTSQNPTIALSTKTSDGTGTGSFTSNLTGLIANTTYYVRSYATNCAGTAYGSEVSFTTAEASQGLPCQGVPTVTDIDGNTYNTVQIGEQCWTKENLRVTKYRDSTIIPTGLNGTDWYNSYFSTSGAYAIYNNDNAIDVIYGKLYNWYAVVDTRALCPTGWHVPSNAEWTTLTNYLGGESVAGAKMKSTGTALWTSPNEGASNESGFSGLPGGSRGDSGGFGSLSSFGVWWSSSESDLYHGWILRLDYSDGDVGRFYTTKGHGSSVRCLKD